jgi:cell wall-associated NlpC family hydrolase
MMLPHGSAAQSLIGDEIAKAEALPGDLIFFKGHNSGVVALDTLVLLQKLVIPTSSLYTQLGMAAYVMTI